MNEGEFGGCGGALFMKEGEEGGCGTGLLINEGDEGGWRRAGAGGYVDEVAAGEGVSIDANRFCDDTPFLSS
jgi:hypothetical protein